MKISYHFQQSALQFEEEYIHLNRGVRDANNLSPDGNILKINDSL